MAEALTCRAFAKQLHLSLRALIDQLAVTSFNVAILGVSPDPYSQDRPIVAR